MRTLLIFCMMLTGPAVFANVLNVGKDQLLHSLKEAVKLAKPHDSILLNKGVYREGNIVINKPLSLIGVDNPVLDGENRYEILTLSGSAILVRGIQLINAGYSSMNDFAAIDLIDAQYCIIEDNEITGSYFGIHVANSRHCVLLNNKVSGIPKTEQTSGNGIHLWKCDSMVVKYNELSGHRDGIYFEFVTNSIIWQNNSHNNIRYGLHFMFSNNDAYIQNTFKENGAGVAVMYSHHVLMLKNRFEYNWGGNAYGLLLKEISDAQISQNQFVYNTVGILMESTNRVDAQLNGFHNNGFALRIQASCDQNLIHFNNFQGNSFDIATNGSMMLSRFYNNYWDKYEGYDLDRNAVGDVPYHPVSMYSMVIEQNPPAVMLMKSFMVALLDRAEKALPSITPELMIDEHPLMKALHL